MTDSHFISTSESATLELGEKLGRALDEPCLVFLKGTLGAGKTRMVQAIAAGLGIDPETVCSPTFTIMIPYQGRMQLLHVDAYRINDLDEAEQLGLQDWLDDGCVMVIEWPERIAEVLPTPDLTIAIEPTGENERQFVFQSHSKSGLSLLDRAYPNA